jgi:glycine oxidase
LGIRSLEEYDSFIERVVIDSRLPIEYRRTGTWQVARNATEASELERLAQELARRGVACELATGAQIAALEPALAPLKSGLLTPQQGYVGVATLMAALAEAAASRGASLSIRRVERIGASSPAGVHLDTSEGPLDVDAVVIAAGSWSGTIPMSPAAPPPVQPIRGQLLQLRFPAPPVSRVVWGAAGYLVPWTDGRLLVGATVEDAGFDDRVTEAGVQYLRNRGAELLPAVRSATLEEARAGLRPKTRDELPIIGASSTMPGVFYATGHYRNGVLLAPLTGSIIADLVLDGREPGEISLVSPARFGL